MCSEVFSAPSADGDAAPRPAYVALAPKSGGAGGVWRGGLVVLLVLLLGAQLAWLARERLAVYPLFQAFFTTVCQPLGCRVPVFRDLAAIDVSDARVTSHPEYADALLATVTLRNRAQAAQPWPRLGLSLTAADGSTVAARLFQPAEYLPATRQGEAMFAADAVVQLRLPLADPGGEAAGFRVTLH
ncbi:MAG: hypothetical protein Kow0073_03610 [Immundisolibacter sp.]